MTQVDSILDIKNNKQVLLTASKRLKELEEKIAILEKQIPRIFPDVRYLNYLSRKRILVSFIKTSLVELLEKYRIVGNRRSRICWFPFG